MNSILLAILLTAATPPFEVQTLDGQMLIGPLVEWNADRLTIDAADGRVSIGTDRLLSVSNPNIPAQAPAASGIIVTLTDGSTIRARQYTAGEAEATITLPEGNVLKTPVNTVETVQLHRVSDALSAEWSRLTDRNVDSDLLVIRNAQNLDYHKGILHEVTDDIVHFNLDGELLPVKRSKVFAFAYRHPSGAELPPAVCRIQDSAGSQWSVQSLELPSHTGRGVGGEGSGEGHNEQTDSLADRPHPNPLPKGEGTFFNWTTPTGLQVSLPVDKIVQIDFSVGKIVYLSDLTPERVRWTPYFDAGKPPAAVERFYAPRYDRSFESGPLQLGGTQYRKGLALHSRTEIVFRLPNRFSHFRALAGIADAIRPGGNVRLLIRGDNRDLFDGVVTDNDAPRPIELDLTGVRRLTIVVDFGNSPGMGNTLLLCNARLSK